MNAWELIFDDDEYDDDDIVGVIQDCTRLSKCRIYYKYGAVNAINIASHPFSLIQSRNTDIVAG